jgi:uncharacterized protein with PQ loop repeat
VEICGWLGAFFLSVCGVPQAIKTFYTKRANDLSWLFILSWGVGEVLICTYILHDNYTSQSWQLPLIANYVFNILVIFYLFYAKIIYRNNI